MISIFPIEYKNAVIGSCVIDLHSEKIGYLAKIGKRRCLLYVEDGVETLTQTKSYGFMALPVMHYFEVQHTQL